MPLLFFLCVLSGFYGDWWSSYVILVQYSFQLKGYGNYKIDRLAWTVLQCLCFCVAATSHIGSTLSKSRITITGWSSIAVGFFGAPFVFTPNPMNKKVYILYIVGTTHISTVRTVHTRKGTGGFYVRYKVQSSTTIEGWEMWKMRSTTTVTLFSSSGD